MTLDLTVPDAQEIGNAVHQENATNNTTQNSTASFISAVNNLITLSQQLLAQVPSATPELVKSVHSIHSHLCMVASATSDDQLPEKDMIAPNQLSWPETAKHMGVKWGGKHQGKVNSTLSAQLIGKLNHKWNHTDQDPYGASEQSGKHARPNAHSVAANTQVRAAAEPAPVPLLPLSTPLPSLPPSAPLPSLPGPAPLPSSSAVPTVMPHYTSMQPYSLLQPATASFTYIPQPYMHYPYTVPMYYPPT